MFSNILRVNIITAVKETVETKYKNEEILSLLLKINNLFLSIC